MHIKSYLGNWKKNKNKNKLNYKYHITYCQRQKTGPIKTLQHHHKVTHRNRSTCILNIHYFIQILTGTCRFILLHSRRVARFHPSNLRIFKYLCILDESLILKIFKFLKYNGKNLIDLCIDDYRSLNLAIIRCCPNLRNLVIILKKDETDILRNMFNDCSHLESIKVWCGNDYVNEEDILDIVATCSPKNFHRLKI